MLPYAAAGSTTFRPATSSGDEVLRPAGGGELAPQDLGGLAAPARRDVIRFFSSHARGSEPLGAAA